MSQDDHDRAFLGHLNSLINTGRKEVEVPGEMMVKASDQALEEAHRLCKLTGATIKRVRFGSDDTSIKDRPD
jgi:hypothetical protein